jgi:uncharacterized membrane protein YjfL (UPF0719 family)
MELSSVLAGLVAFAVAVLASVLLVFVTYRVNTVLTSKLDEERLLLSGNRSVAIALGAVVLSQGVLLRHAVFPTMVVVRELFLRPVTARDAAWVAGHALLFFVLMSLLSFGSVVLGGWMFARMTRALPERAEILRDNVAVAVFFAFVVLGITAILNEGMEDLSRSIIPYGPSGFTRIGGGLVPGSELG